MKVLAVVSVFALVTWSSVYAQAQGYTEEQKLKILKNRDDCIVETEVNPELIEKADKGDFTDDDKLKCFTKCFYQKAGFVSDQGELHLDAIKAKIPEEDRETALKIVEKCQQKGDDPCETVFLIHKCYFQYTHNPEMLKQIGNNNQTTTVNETSKEEKVEKLETKTEKKEEKKQ